MVHLDLRFNFNILFNPYYPFSQFNLLQCLPRTRKRHSYVINVSYNDTLKVYALDEFMISHGMGYRRLAPQYWNANLPELLVVCAIFNFWFDAALGFQYIVDR